MMSKASSQVSLVPRVLSTSPDKSARDLTRFTVDEIIQQNEAMMRQFSAIVNREGKSISDVMLTNQKLQNHNSQLEAKLNELRNETVG